MKEQRECDILLELASADLKLVEKNLYDREIRPQILLFHLQQAVEKLLKSLLAYHGIKFPKVHDIEMLLELCEKNQISLPEYVDEFIDLTPYAVEFRYGLLIEDMVDVEYYFNMAKNFRGAVEKVLKEFKNEGMEGKGQN